MKEPPAKHTPKTPTSRITRRPEQELFLRFATVERTNQRKAVDGTAMSGLYMDRTVNRHSANHQALLLLTCINQIAVSHGLDLTNRRRRKKEKEKICEQNSNPWFLVRTFDSFSFSFLTFFFFSLTVLVSSVALISRPLQPHWPVPTQSDLPRKKKQKINSIVLT